MKVKAFYMLFSIILLISFVMMAGLIGCKVDKTKINSDDSVLIVASILNTEDYYNTLKKILDENNIQFSCWGSLGLSVGIRKKDSAKARQVIQQAVNDGKLKAHVYNEDIPANY